MNALERLYKVQAEENGEKYYAQAVNKKRAGVRCNDKYKEILNNMKRIYYKEFYMKDEYVYKWNKFANETGLYYSLEKIYDSIDPKDYNTLKFIIANPYNVKYIWD